MKCLVTTFPVSVNNDRLLKINEFRLFLKPNPSVSGTIAQINIATSVQEVSIIGEGNFLNSDGTVIGKTTTISNIEYGLCYVSSDVRCISFPDRNKIKRIGHSIDSYVASLVGNLYVASCLMPDMDISLFRYIPLEILALRGDNFIGSLNNIPVSTQVLQVYSGNIHYDSDEFFKAKPYSFYVSKTANGINFDDAPVGYENNIGSFSLTDPLSYGDLSNRDFKRVTVFEIGKNMTGDICSALSNSASLKSLKLWQTPNVSGDIGVLSHTIVDVILIGGGHTYIKKNTNRTNMIVGKIKLDYGVDAFLNDMAELNIPTGVDAKALTITGVRTSASDAAITALTNKGITITIKQA